MAVAAPPTHPGPTVKPHACRNRGTRLPGCLRSATHAGIELTAGSGRNAGARLRSQQPDDFRRPSLVVTDQHVVAGT